jgi:hypothetical protein
MSIKVVRFSERTDLWERIDWQSGDIWPEYNLHGDVLNGYFGKLYDAFAAWQFVLYDEDSETVLAEGHTIPVAWDGTDGGLGPGIDATIAAGFGLQAAGGPVTALCALAAEIPPRHRDRRLSAEVLRAMSGLAREAGLPHLVAPVRPSRKDHYPTIAIDQYARWTRDDGLPFDPWIRVHARLGARIGPAIPRSLKITGTVAEWETWTGMAFPGTGDYVFPAGLATVRIDRERDTGEYWEPNVWIIHAISPPDHPG